jgi:hypothetical protein
MNHGSIQKIRAARNPYTPQEKLVELAGDDFWLVRFWVLENPSAPDDAIILAKAIDFVSRHL